MLNKYPMGCLLIVVMLAGCSKAPLHLQLPDHPPQDWRIAGFDTRRTSARAESLTVPLQEIARLKLSSAAAQNLFVARGFLFAPTLDGRIYVVDLEKLEIVRKWKLPQGNAGTLAATSNTIVIAMRYGKHTLAHFDLATGKRRWSIDAGDIASEPLIADSLLFVAALYQRVDAYRLRDGYRCWQFKTRAQLHASPALGEGVLVVAADDGMVYGLRPETGKKIWEADLERPVLATPVIQGQRVFIGTARDQVVALDLFTGEVLWRFATPGRVFHAPAVNDSLLILACADGRLRALAPATGQLLWESRALSVIGTSPLLAGETVFFGALDRHLYAVRARNGELIWRQELHGRVRTNPILWQGHLILASEDRELYIFGPPRPAGGG